MKKAIIFLIALVMIFSSFVIVFNVGYEPQLNNQKTINKSPQAISFTGATGAGNPLTVSAELNFTQAGVSTTFDRIQASVSHTEFDLGQSVTVHFSNSYVCIMGPQEGNCWRLLLYYHLSSRIWRHTTDWVMANIGI